MMKKNASFLLTLLVSFFLNFSYALDGSIKRANLDATSIETIVETDNAPRAVRIDFTGTKLYWNPNSSGALPLELVSFSGRPNETSIRINWTTTIKLNNQGFEVQKSQDLTHWENLAFIESKVSGTGSNEYQYTEKQAFSGDKSCRLKQIDDNGRLEYSTVRRVSFTTDLIPLITIYPNPNRGHFSFEIHNPDQQPVHVCLFSSAGLLIWEKGFEQGAWPDLWQPQCDPLSLGVYFLKAQIGQVVETQKVTGIRKP